MSRRLPLLRGAGRYLPDLCRGDILWANFVRSTQAHAIVQSVKLADEDRDAGIQLFTGADIASLTKPASVGGHGVLEYPLPALATDRVRHIGEPLAMVVGPDRYRLEDCADRVQVLYEPLPIVSSIEDALSAETLLHPEVGTNVLFASEHEFETAISAVEAAPVSLDHTFRYGRQTPLPLEGRGVLVTLDNLNDSLVVYSSTQIPHLVRSGLAMALSIPEEDIRVIRPDVGGGFGLKTQVWNEEIAMAAIAVKIGRSIAWVEDRRENLLASSHAHDVEVRIRLGASEEGVLLAAAAEVVQDLGAHNARYFGAMLEPVTAIFGMFGPYRLTTFGYKSSAVATNKLACGAYRGVGAVPGTFAVERMMDFLAAQVGVQPEIIRRRNLLSAADFPYTSGTGKYHDAGNYLATLDACLARAEELEEQTPILGNGRDTVRIGTGIACIAKSAALGSAFFLTRPDTGTDGVRISVSQEGTVEVFLGTASSGSSNDISFESLVSRLLTIPREKIRVVEGDTALCPVGTGAINSRSGIVIGAAAHLACEEIIQKAKRVAARLLKIEGDVDLVDGMFVSEGDQTKRVPFDVVARASHARLEGFELPADMDPGLTSTRVYDPPFAVPTGACHSATVQVDLETGEVRVLRYVAVEDSGPSLDATVVDEQTIGGVAQGIGCALFEELLYDENGELRTGSLMDYLVPLAGDVPVIDVVRLSTPSSLPGGYRGVGEPGVVGAPAAIAAAVADALGADANPIDVIPLTPERVLQLTGRLKASGSIQE